jgi:hypothetical protein
MDATAKPGSKPARRARDEREIMLKLERQLKLLRTFSKNAFERHDSSYCPETAGKLRLLLVRTKMNRPLLLDAAELFGVSLTVTVAPSPVKREGDLEGEVTLDQFFDMTAYMYKLPDGSVAKVSKLNLIRAWGEQEGGAHLDWEVEAWLTAALRSWPVKFNGLNPSELELLNCANLVLEQGEKVVAAARTKLGGT